MSDHFLAFYRDSVLNRLYNDFPGAIDGSTWPPGAVAQTMSGVRRADNVVSLLAAAVEDGIPGHFIETGACLLPRARILWSTRFARYLCVCAPPWPLLARKLTMRGRLGVWVPALLQGSGRAVSHSFEDARSAR
jgi:hypothetical protein